MAKICLIAAVGTNLCIGNGGQLPWAIPADLKHFKNLTTGYPIVMGRKTFDSIGRPLPKRQNIVITRQGGYHPDGVVIANSLWWYPVSGSHRAAGGERQDLYHWRG